MSTATDKQTCTLTPLISSIFLQKFNYLPLFLLIMFCKIATFLITDQIEHMNQTAVYPTEVSCRLHQMHSVRLLVHPALLLVQRN